MTAGPEQFRTLWIVPAICCGSLVAFGVDMTTVTTLPFGICYVPLVGSALLIPSVRAEWLFAALACAMVFVGSFSPTIDPDIFELAVNRALSIAAILGTATFVHHMRSRGQSYDISPPASPVIWERSGDVYYAEIADVADATSFYLVVEPTGSDWNWAVWRPRESELDARRGRGPSVQEAIREAERATRQ